MNDTEYLKNLPLGADLDPVAREEVLGYFASSGVNVAPTGFSGAFEHLRSTGISFFSLRNYERDFIRDQGARLVKSRRPIAPSGILAPLRQRTGICNGCSFSLAAWISWVAHYQTTRTGPVPREVSFAAAYLGSRGGLRGDSGAYPSHAAKMFHDVGVLPIDTKGRYNLADMTPSQQEDIAIWLRDNPVFEKAWLDSMQELTCRVTSPRSQDEVLDSISSLCCVTNGMSVQPAPPRVGSDGVSSFYSLNGGHETAISGWFVYRNRIGVIQDNSWGDIPATDWPEKRISIRTDDGVVKLFEGEAAIWLDELASYRPEWWTVGNPGGLRRAA